VRPLFVYFVRVSCASALACKAGLHVVLNVLFLNMSFCLLYQKQSYFCHLSLYIYTQRDIFVILFYFLYYFAHIPLSPEVTLTSVSKGGVDSRGSWTVSQCLFQDVEGGLSRSPWYQEEVSSMCGFVSITI
jgi:hypothetical protein